MLDEDPYDGDWDDYEPTEREMLAVYVADDAADPDSDLLAWRQTDRWERFRQRQQEETQRALAALKKADKPRTVSSPTWWKLWTPPSVSRENLPDDEPQLIKQGILSISTEIRMADVRSMYYGHDPVCQVMDSYSIYMDFEPYQQWGIPNLAFLSSIAKDGMISSEIVNGPWGWWDSEKGRFRSRIKAAITKRDPDDPLNAAKHEVAVKMVGTAALRVLAADLRPTRAREAVSVPCRGRRKTARMHYRTPVPAIRWWISSSRCLTGR